MLATIEWQQNRFCHFEGRRIRQQTEEISLTTFVFYINTRRFLLLRRRNEQHKHYITKKGKKKPPPNSEGFL